MIEPLQYAVAGLALLLAAVATVYVVLDRPTGPVLLAGLGLLELAVLAQAVLGIVQLAGTERDVNGVVFVGYLLGLVVFVPVAAVWALGERSRAGTAALIVLGLVVPFLELRLDQIWNPGG